MKESGITIGQLMEQISPGAIEKGLTQHLKQHGAPQGTLGLIGGFVSEQTARVVEEELLKVDAFSVLARAWVTAAELHKYADAAKYPSTSPQKVVLTKKSVSAPLDVELKLELEGLPVIPLVLTVDLKAAFDCVTLTVAGARLTSADLGSATASVGLSYGDVVLVEPKKTEAVQLGARLDLGEGIPIP